MRFRPATPEDIAKLSELAPLPCLSVSTPPPSGNGTSTVSTSPEDLTVGEACEGIYGYYRLSENVLTDLFVRPDARGRGFGAHILKNAEKRARKAGHRELTARIPVNNESGKAFLLSCGFSEPTAVYPSTHAFSHNAEGESAGQTPKQSAPRHGYDPAYGTELLDFAKPLA